MNRPSEPSQAPVQQRLFALLHEVRDLLHRVLPEHAGVLSARVLRSGVIVLDLERLTVTEQGRAVPLTTREVMVLRYLMQRPDRVVTREQLLTEVWGYAYTGDARTVAVHMSRLRQKLPSLRDRLVAVKHLGYRLTSTASIERAS